MHDLDLDLDLDATPANRPSLEEQRILAWRYEQLRELGLSEVHAQLLAESGSDLGLVRRLVAGGCTPALAFRISF